MVLEAAQAFDIDLANSWFIGDKAADIEGGRRAGTHCILVLTGYGREQACQPDLTAENAVEAIELILNMY